MKTLNDVWTLIKFEYKMTPPSYISAIAMVSLALFLTVSTLTSDEEQAILGTEMLFLVIVIIFPYIVRSEQMRAKGNGNKNHTSPMIEWLQTMPVSHKTIATYRMTSFTIMIIVFNSTFFTLLYALTPYVRSIAPIPTYIVFVLIWICFAIYAGGFQVQYEAGYHFLTYLLSAFLIWIPLIIFSGVVLFYKIYTKGMIQWMIDVSAAHPFIVVGTSIILAIAGYAWHIRRFTKRMGKTDY